MVNDIKVYGGPRDGADLTYRQLAFMLMRRELDGYILDQRRTGNRSDGEEYLVLIHATWVAKPHA